MHTNHPQSDSLKKLFSQLPEEELPNAFREKVMQQIAKETSRSRKRNELLGMMTIIVASLVLAALAVCALLYIKIPKPTLYIPNLAILTFYLYIGALALLLLGVDYGFRQFIKKRQSHHPDL